MKSTLKTWLRICFCLIIAIGLSLSLFKSSSICYATYSIDDYKDYPMYDFIITNYDVNIKVNKNNCYEVTENITTYFNSSGLHEFLRYIPIVNHVYREDSSSDKYIAKIGNIDSDYDFYTYDESEYLVIVLHDGSNTIPAHTETVYSLSYTFDAGKDLLKNADEFYFNIIGVDSHSLIGNVTFSIEMPKEFDASNIGFTHGIFGSSQTDNVYYETNGNVISGYYNEILGDEEGLTIRVELPNNYFTYTRKITTFQIITIIIPIFIVAILSILWIKFSKNKDIVTTVEFYPPNKWNSFDTSFYYHGYSSEKDFTALLIELANKGYIKIIETENNSQFLNVKTTTLEKVKEYDGNNDIEKTFLKNLFSTGDSIGLNSETTTLRRYIPETLSKLNKYSNKSKIHHQNTILLISMIISILLICYTSVALPYFPYHLKSSANNFVFVIIFFAIWDLSSIYMLKTSQTREKFIARFLTLPIGIIMPLLELITNNYFLLLKQEPFYIATLVLLILSFVTLSYFIAHIKKRTDYGNEHIGKILGFKQFLKTAEKEKLEMLVNENPSYFFDILPYTYLFGLSDKWIKKFESITITQPAWYVSASPFTTHTFNSTLNNISSTIKTSSRTNMSGRGFSGGGGGFSGGGFSGGGGGGGGCGAR